MFSNKKKINIKKNFSSLDASKKINFTSEKSISKYSEINLNNFISNNISFNNVISSNNSICNGPNIMINESSINKTYNKTQKKTYNFKKKIEKNENKVDIMEYKNMGNNDFKEGKDFNYYTNEKKREKLIIDENVLKYVEEFGYKREYIIKSLECDELNHAIACYYLKLSLDNK